MSRGRRRSVAVWLGLAIGLAGLAASEPAVDVAALSAIHERNGRFFNPWGEGDRSLWRVLRWQLFTRNPYDKSTPPRTPTVANDGAYLAERGAPVSLTWVGHATFAIHDGGDVVLTDPHFGERAAIPRRKVPPGVPLVAIPAEAFAVISHNHYDHMDAFAVDRLPAEVGWYVPLGLADWFRARGREDVVELDWWESATRGRWTITCLPSQHWSARLGMLENSTLWCSWLLDSGDHRYYFAGDTGYFHGFAEYGRRFAPIDAALLPIGAYEPRWFMGYQHMDPAEAYRAFLDLGARYMLPLHWGTFDLTDEPVDLAPAELARVIAERGDSGANVATLAVGERWLLPERGAGTAEGGVPAIRAQGRARAQ